MIMFLLFLVILLLLVILVTKPLRRGSPPEYETIRPAEPAVPAPAEGGVIDAGGLRLIRRRGRLRGF